jgi:AraC family transcriptional regulator of adaptative response / DNA-3-methyladenine glycosylase II
VRTPKRENCSFFPSAAAAEVAGFRPCLRCRPELAPGYAAIDASAQLAQTAASLIEDGLVDDMSVAAVAGRLGVTGRHLRRIFQAQFGVSPVEFAQTQRLLLAKRLLSDTALSITEVAMASGFGSVRRCNALFRSQYRMSPSELRKSAQRMESNGVLVFQLGYRAPFDWPALLAFLAARAVEGVEEIEGLTYRRTVRLEHAGKQHAGWIALRLSGQRPALEVALSPSLAKAIPLALARVKRLCDLQCDPAEIERTLGALAARNPGLRVPGAFDGFEIAVRAILGQQVTVKAARTVAGRFAASFGEPLVAPFAGLRYLFPTAARVAALSVSQIAELGIVSARAKAIIALAQAMVSGALDLDPRADTEVVLDRLRGLPGIGEWTTQYLAMRALTWPDAFPHSDYGVLKALGVSDPRKALERAAQWRPWRAYAVMHLWKSLEAK